MTNKNNTGVDNTGCFVRGRKPWNLGISGYSIKYPLKRKPKKKLSQKHRKNIKANVLKGKEHPKWKGGIYPENEKIRHSTEYKEWRIKIFERDDYTCQKCERVGCELNADHIKSFALFPELRFEISNGRTLCIECHRATPTFGGNSRCKALGKTVKIKK